MLKGPQGRLYARNAAGGAILLNTENIKTVYAPAFATIPTKLGVVAYDTGTQIDTKQHEGSLTLELDTGIGMLKSITGYSQVTGITSFDFDGSYLNGQWITTTGRNRTLRLGLWATE